MNRFFSNALGMLAALTLLGFGLRLIQLDFQPLWWDEGYSVYFATRAFAEMLARTAIDIHPPLYYATLQTWLALFGKNAVALRMLSVVIGTSAIPLVYLVARELFNSRPAIVATFLLVFAPLHIYYSQELRMYGLVTTLALASVFLQLQLLESKIDNLSRTQVRERKSKTMLYVVITALVLYTQYLAAFILAAQIAVVFYLKFRARWKIELRAWYLAWGAVGALYLPWVIYAGPKLFAYVTQKVGIEQYAPLDPLTYLAQHTAAFSMGHVSEWTWLAWGALVFVALAFLGFLASRKYHMGDGNSPFAIHNALAAIYLFVPLALGFLVNLVFPFHPIRYERLLLFAAPFFLIYVACGIVALWERERGLGIVAVGACVVLSALTLFDFYIVPRYPDEDYRPLIHEMENLAAENDLVYAVYPWQSGYLETYYRGEKLNVVHVDGEAWMRDRQVMEREIGEMRERGARAWIPAYQTQGRILEDRLLNEYVNDYVILDQTFGNTRLAYFARGAATDFELPPIVFSRDLTLRIHYAAFEPLAKPNLALARFAWNANRDVYAYSLRVVDAQGNKIAQQDAPIPNGASSFKRALAIPKNLAAGEYVLQLIAYHRADGSPLSAPNGSHSVALAKIVVAP